MPKGSLTRAARRTAVALAAAAVAAGSYAGSAAATPGEAISFSQKGVSATAFWERCRRDTPRPGTTTCTDTGLFVFQGREDAPDTGRFKGTRVCLDVSTFSFRDESARRAGAVGTPYGSGFTYEFESGCTTA